MALLLNLDRSPSAVQFLSVFNSYSVKPPSPCTFIKSFPKRCYYTLHAIMEGVFAACKESASQIASMCIRTRAYKEEAIRLGRYVAKLALVLTELSLHMQLDDSLRGSESLFLAGEKASTVLQQAEELLRQCVNTSTSAAIWPMEDAAEFQSAATELSEAANRASKNVIVLFVYCFSFWACRVEHRCCRGMRTS